MTALLSCALVLSACVKMPRRYAIAANQNARQQIILTTASAPRININTATISELEKLPGIGEGLAARIIAHREQYGRFPRVEHLIMVRGISERRFQAMRPFITVE